MISDIARQQIAPVSVELALAGREAGCKPPRVKTQPSPVKG